MSELDKFLDTDADTFNVVQRDRRDGCFFEADQVLEVVSVDRDAGSARVKNLPKWIPCTKQMPDAGEKVLATNGRDVASATFSGGKLFWCLGDILLGVTHWMPLPEPPK